MTKAEIVTPGRVGRRLSKKAIEERNKRIVELRESGLKLWQLAERFGLSIRQVKTIIKETRKNER